MTTKNEPDIAHFFLELADPENEGAKMLLKLPVKNLKFVARDLKDTIEGKEGFAEEHIRLLAYTVLGFSEEENLPIVSELELVAGKPAEVIAWAEEKFLTKNEALSMLTNAIERILELSDLRAASLTLVFDDEEGPQAGGNVLASPVAEARHHMVLVNSIEGQREHYLADLAKRGIEIPGQPGSATIATPGDAGFDAIRQGLKRI